MIITLSLDEEQQAVLIEQLDCCLDDLRTEIMDTDRRDFKEQLKKRRDILQHVLKSLREAAPSQQIA
jgi:hypothetical protein